MKTIDLDDAAMENIQRLRNTKAKVLSIIHESQVEHHGQSIVSNGNSNSSYSHKKTLSNLKAKNSPAKVNVNEMNLNPSIDETTNFASSPDDQNLN